MSGKAGENFPFEKRLFFLGLKNRLFPSKFSFVEQKMGYFLLMAFYPVPIT
jgi:hypothetical protein